MTLRQIQVVGVVLAGLGAGMVSGRDVSAQAVRVGPAEQKVATQIIPADQEDEFIKGTVALKTPGLVKPKLTRGADPKYTPEALRAKIEGTVRIEAIVGVDGRVEKSRVKESLDPALDAEARRTLDLWEFQPARLNSSPVRALIEVEMAFRVHR